MFRPTCSRQQSKEIESQQGGMPNPSQALSSKKLPVLVDSRGQPDFWSMYQAQKAAANQQSPANEAVVGDEKTREDDLVESQQRYAGFLQALNSSIDMKPVVQSQIDKPAKLASREMVSVDTKPIKQHGGSGNTALDRQKANLREDVEEKSKYLEKYAFDDSKYRFNNPVMGMSRISADLDFRGSIMRGTRLD